MLAPSTSRFRTLLLAALLAPLVGAGCASSQTAGTPPTSESARVRSVDAGEPFRLALGATAERDGHTVRFAEVVEDSRCPVGVQCVTEGRARVRVEVDGEPFVLSVPHARMANDEASMVEWGTIQVVVTDLEPAPGAGGGDTPEAVLVTRPSTV